MSDVTKLLVNYAKAGGSLQKLEEEMIKEVTKDLKKLPAARKRSDEEIQDVAKDLVRSHIAKRFKEKLSGVVND